MCFFLAFLCPRVLSQRLEAEAVARASREAAIAKEAAERARLEKASAEEAERLAQEEAARASGGIEEETLEFRNGNKALAVKLPRALVRTVISFDFVA